VSAAGDVAPVSSLLIFRMGRERLALLLVCAALPVALVIGLTAGGVHAPWSSWQSILAGQPDTLGSLLLSIRLPRVLMAGVTGAALAMAGASMQALFRNPLADPGLTGAAAGGMLAVVATMVLFHGLAISWAGGLGLYVLPFIAALTSAATTLAVYVLARSREGALSVAHLLLAGLGVNAIAAAATGLLITIADDGQMRSIQFWMMGSLSGATWISFAVTGMAVAAAGFLLIGSARALDAFTLGEAEAFTCGVDTGRLKRLVVIASAGATGATVAFTGMIGFVGLIAPHCARMLCGQRNAMVLPASAALGAVMVILADAVARAALAPAEIPISLVTNLIGAPVFLMLLRRAAQR